MKRIGKNMKKLSLLFLLSMVCNAMELNTVAPNHQYGAKLQARYIDALAERFSIPYAIEHPSDPKSQVIKRYVESAINVAFLFRSYEKHVLNSEDISEIDEALCALDEDNAALTRIMSGAYNYPYISLDEFKEKWNKIQHEIFIEQHYKNYRITRSMAAQLKQQ